ncbi:transcriptional regulator [Massilia sp. Root418]|jgi:two-component system nitrate/nitrite sensor histidine kinase NarX|uniref:type IV pili methyl-accepting chemotaxis transducer N-terminal domain-containing protein n=1 Tax=Massilia sp. Root418 TaxID=1736532 RepID=UPI0006F71C1A|nr:type IV pili methyl-accepting chemotaxis transducer N-terminal domain-containing protein [Massilia sp. Root418]KQW93548.1 transcriptional regulator [Massilia sp. Root418]
MAESIAAGRAAGGTGARPPLFAAWQKLSTRIVGVLVSFLAVALLVIGATLLLSWQLEGSAAAINVTGSLRMHSYKLGMQLSNLQERPDAAAAREEVRLQAEVIGETLDQLRHGDPRRPLFLPPASVIRSNFNVVERQWREELAPLAATLMRQQSLSATDVRMLQGRTARFVAAADSLVQQIERDSEERTFWLRASQLVLLALALVGTVSIIYLFFNMIVTPVTRLQAGMERMRERDFEVRLPVDSQDELGQLTVGFNQMADRLQRVYSGLSDLVSSKTAALEEQNRELALLYDAAAFLQQPQPAEALCEGFLQRLCDYFGADGGTVRMLDPLRGNLHMLVHRGISSELVEDEHCIKVGDCLCGDAVQQKVSVVHDMRRLDPAMDLRCHREGYATVSVFHIYAQQQHLGFFNLHFRQPTLIDERRRALLDTLGQLLGTAIENQRLAGREREMAISEERNLVAQGLHDSIAQGLNFLHLQVQMLEQSLEAGEQDEAAAIVPQLRAGVEESYQDVRELLHNFRARLPEGNIATSLQETVDKFRRQTGIPVELVADSDGAPLPREQQLQLLFIVQEALSNVRKHAGASQVKVQLQDRQDFSLSIEDNGAGFAPEKLPERGEGHVGIHIMRERAQRIDARLEVQSSPGAGTRVELHLPKAARRAA